MPARFSLRSLSLVLPAFLALSAGLRADDAPAPDSGKTAKALQPFIDNQTVAGAVLLVANKDQVIDLEAVGYSNLATRKPMAVGDEFWIASMSKAFCASLVMMLAEEGKLSIDDPVEKYIPEFQGQMVIDPKDPTHTPHTPDHPIKIRELLDHTSGLTMTPLIKGAAGDRLSLKDETALYAKEALQFQPGTKFRYTNEGPNTAGRIVEIVSGMPYEQFLQERLLTPLGMTNTTFWPNAEQLSRLAETYHFDPATQQLVDLPKLASLSYPLDNHTKRFAFPAGGLFSTAEDVCKFCQMLLNDGVYNGKQYLSPESIHLMTTKETGDQVSSPYGFCLKVDEDGFGHAGADGTNMYIDKKIGLITVFMVQRVQKSPPALLLAFRKAANSLVPNGDEGSTDVNTVGGAGDLAPAKSP
jgi:CubicO group peptidase (beta-lactamase class C family)